MQRPIWRLFLIQPSPCTAGRGKFECKHSRASLQLFQVRNRLIFPSVALAGDRLQLPSKSVKLRGRLFILQWFLFLFLITLSLSKTGPSVRSVLADSYPRILAILKLWKRCFVPVRKGGPGGGRVVSLWILLVQRQSWYTILLNFSNFFWYFFNFLYSLNTM